MPPTAALHVRGLTDLIKAFAVADASLRKELRDTLKDVGEPVRADAERLAVAQIPTVTLPWSRMRVGLTTRLVYVAPVERGVRSGPRRRPRFAGKLLRPMQQALEQNIGETERRFDRMLAEVGKDWERA